MDANTYFKFPLEVVEEFLLFWEWRKEEKKDLPRSKIQGFIALIHVNGI